MISLKSRWTAMARDRAAASFSGAAGGSFRCGKMPKRAPIARAFSTVSREHTPVNGGTDGMFQVFAVACAFHRSAGVTVERVRNPVTGSPAFLEGRRSFRWERNRRRARIFRAVRIRIRELGTGLFDFCPKAGATSTLRFRRAGANVAA